MKNNLNILKISNLNNKKYEITSPNHSSNFNELFQKNNYILRTKNIFTKEKPKDKECIFKELTDTSKKMILKDKLNLRRKQRQLLASFAILNDTSLDEGIVLNKYFAYLKRIKIEENEQLHLKYLKMLIPIKQKEKEIQEIKRKIKFFKSVSDRMLLKYMVDNKEKFTKYLDDVKNNRIKTYISYDEAHKSNPFSNSQYGNDILLTSPNYRHHKQPDLKRRFLENKDKKFLTLGNNNNNNSNNNNNEIDNNKDMFITSCSRNVNIFHQRNRLMSSILVTTPKNSYRKNQKYNTTQINREKINDNSSDKSLFSVNFRNQRKKSKVQNIFNRIKINEN
jgi:hypothetical protein